VKLYVLSIKKIKSRKKNLKKDFFFALIISVKGICRRDNGCYIKADENRGLLLTKSLKFVGTRIYGPVYNEIRDTSQKKTIHKKLISYI